MLSAFEPYSATTGPGDVLAFVLLTFFLGSLTSVFANMIIFVLVSTLTRFLTGRELYSGPYAASGLQNEDRAGDTVLGLAMVGGSFGGFIFWVLERDPISWLFQFVSALVSS
jgi:hypothetical protein